jgi:hypothetical protein
MQASVCQCEVRTHDEQQSTLQLLLCCICCLLSLLTDLDVSSSCLVFCCIGCLWDLGLSNDLHLLVDCGTGSETEERVYRMRETMHVLSV